MINDQYRTKLKAGYDMKIVHSKSKCGNIKGDAVRPIQTVPTTGTGRGKKTPNYSQLPVFGDHHFFYPDG